MGSRQNTAIAVFGSSEPVEGNTLYEEARLVGRLLAREGYTVVTGGYGGVMEAACRGAVETGGETLGVTTRELDSIRSGPNPYLTRHLETVGLLERTHELIVRSAGYIILRGKAGTLAELAFLWALHRARLQGDRPVVLLGGFWQGFLDEVESLGLVERSQLAVTHVVSTPQDAISLIRRAIG